MWLCTVEYTVEGGLLEVGLGGLCFFWMEIELYIVRQWRSIESIYHEYWGLDYSCDENFYVGLCGYVWLRIGDV